MHDPLETGLHALRVRITRVFPEQIRTAIAPLSDEQLHWRPNESSNSIANILLHLTGSLNHYLNRNLGQLAYHRDRASEFSDCTGRTKSELLEAFDEMLREAGRTLDRITPATLGDPSPEPAMHKLVIEDLINVATHLANHTGQIVWIAKMLDADAVDEVWIRSHRSGGAWPPRKPKDA
jgi:uncharacterized damage-inducible protein DinB